MKIRGIDRNSEICRSLEESRVPLLPFELVLAQRALVSHVARQSELGNNLREAMSQSSETWHDNAPADALNRESVNLAAIAEQTIKVIRNAEIFDYEEDLSDKITLGSIVTVRYGASRALSALILTGVSREVPDEIIRQLEIDAEDVDVVTLSSPIGRAIFGKSTGDKVVFTAPNGREITLSITSTSQIKATMIEQSIS
jgi:transcription elongation GreA/GreB family factor